MAKLSIFRGTTYPFTYTHKDSTGAAVPLTGCTVYFTVKVDIYDTSATDATAVIKKTILPDQHTNAAGGITGWTLNDADTNVTPGKYHFDVIVENASGLSDPPSLFGDFIVKGQPTNRQVGNET